MRDAEPREGVNGEIVFKNGQISKMVFYGVDFLSDIGRGVLSSYGWEQGVWELTLFHER